MKMATDAVTTTPGQSKVTPAAAVGTGSKLTGLGAVVAAIVVMAWLVIVAVLLFRSSDVAVTDSVWSRMLVVLSSIEAVAFAAAGALFGTTIQQRRVQDAKDEAERTKKDAKEAVTKVQQDAAEETKRAKDEATRNADEASRGRALAAAVKASVPAARVEPGVRLEGLQERELLAREVGGAPSSDALEQLGRIAGALFPQQR